MNNDSDQEHERERAYLRNRKFGMERKREERAAKNTEKDSVVRFLVDKEQRRQLMGPDDSSLTYTICDRILSSNPHFPSLLRGAHNLPPPASPSTSESHENGVSGSIESVLLGDCVGTSLNVEGMLFLIAGLCLLEVVPIVSSVTLLFTSDVLVGGF
nr:hypothetical protein Iba_chr04eCG12920 [Ipomoea batatas]